MLYGHHILADFTKSTEWDNLDTWLVINGIGWPAAWLTFSLLSPFKAVEGALVYWHRV